MRCFIVTVNYLFKNITVSFVDAKDQYDSKFYNDVDKGTVTFVRCTEYCFAEYDCTGKHPFIEDDHYEKTSKRSDHFSFQKTISLGKRYLTSGLNQEVLKPLRLVSDTFIVKDSEFLSKIDMLKGRLDIYLLQEFIDKCLLTDL